MKLKTYNGIGDYIKENINNQLLEDLMREVLNNMGNEAQNVL